MKILYDNKAIATTTTITPSSETVGFEASASLKDTRLARKWRSTGVSSETLVFADTTNAIAATYCIIQAHNLTSGATITLQGNNTNVWTSPAYSVNVPGIRKQAYIVDSAGAYITGADLDPLWGYDFVSKRAALNDIRVVSFPLQGFVYWRLVIQDVGNPAGYIEIGNVYIGKSLDMPGMEPSQQIPYKSTSVAQKSIGAQLYGDSRPRLHAATINFPMIIDELKQEIEYFFDVVDTINPFILLVWENTLENFPPLYSCLTKDLEWAKVNQSGLEWSLNLSFEECK